MRERSRGEKDKKKLSTKEWLKCWKKESKRDISCRYICKTFDRHVVCSMWRKMLITIFSCKTEENQQRHSWRICVQFVRKDFVQITVTKSFAYINSEYASVHSTVCYLFKQTVYILQYYFSL